MAVESSGTILYVANLRTNRITGFKLLGGTKILHRHTHTTEAHFISLVFLQKGRNKTNKEVTISFGSTTFHING